MNSRRLSWQRNAANLHDPVKRSSAATSRGGKGEEFRAAAHSPLSNSVENGFGSD